MFAEDDRFHVDVLNRGSVQETENIPPMEYYTFPSPGIFRVGDSLQFASLWVGALFPCVVSAAGSFKWIRGTPDAIRRTLLSRQKECINSGWFDSFGPQRLSEALIDDHNN